MLLAAFFVITMVIFMMRTGRKLKGRSKGRSGFWRGRIVVRACSPSSS